LETLKLLEVLVFFRDWGCQQAFDGEATCNLMHKKDWATKFKLIFP
jgi:hypothetical protein